MYTYYHYHNVHMYVLQINGSYSVHFPVTRSAVTALVVSFLRGFFRGGVPTVPSISDLSTSNHKSGLQLKTSIPLHNKQ